MPELFCSTEISEKRRVPRPDLSVELGTPNACNRCHIDKSNEWSAEYTSKWYGIKQKFHFGTTFAAARNGKPQAFGTLLQIINDNLTPVLVRATALSLLGRYQGDEVSSAFQQALQGDESLIRRTALAYLPAYLNGQRQKMVAPLLQDPVKAVRIEAARALTAISPEQLDPKWRKAFDKALAEFEQTALYSADFAASRLNLSSLYSYQGKMEAAEKHFKKATEINRDFYTARSNLAVLYSRKGENDLAEQQLRKALEINPELPDVHYSLGLLLSEQKKYNEAVKHLQEATAGMPGNARAHYNLGQLLDFLKQDDAAEKSLRRTVEIDPLNMNYLQTIAQFYLARGAFVQARGIAAQMIVANPESHLGPQLLQYIDANE